MCLGSTKVSMPKAPKLPDPIPAPAPVVSKPVVAPQILQPTGAAPDIRIGSQKKSSARNRNTSGQGMKGSLSIGNSKGLNL